MISAARALKGMVNAIHTYQFEHWPEISRDEHLFLNARQRDILNHAQDLLALSVVVRVTDAAKTIQQITAVTEKMQTAVATITRIQTIIDIAISAAALSFSLVSSNMPGITSSLTELQAAL